MCTREDRFQLLVLGKLIYNMSMMMMCLPLTRSMEDENVLLFLCQFYISISDLKKILVYTVK